MSELTIAELKKERDLIGIEFAARLKVFEEKWGSETIKYIFVNRNMPLLSRKRKLVGISIETSI